MMQSLLGNSSRKPDISFYRSGRIDITSQLSKRLGLEAGDVIGVCFDGMEYYLYVMAKKQNIVGRHEAVCRATNPECPKCRNLRAYSRRLCERILLAAGTEGCARIYAGADATIRGGSKAVIIVPRTANIVNV